MNLGAELVAFVGSGKDASNTRHSVPSGSTVSSTSNDGRCSVSNAKPKSLGSSKKPSAAASSFFDRFRKVGNKGFQNADSAVQKATTSDRDSRPLSKKERGSTAYPREAAMT
ncbi:hypothetical protein Tsubulata_046231, partial [Turnera subulata]